MLNSILLVKLIATHCYSTGACKLLLLYVDHCAPIIIDHKLHAYACSCTIDSVYSDMRTHVALYIIKHALLNFYHDSVSQIDDHVLVDN
jgi:hypothetical protein